MSIYPEPSSSIMTSSSRRRTPAKPPKGVALGLEDEADFGSDEDTMEVVGEIREDAPAPVWYPGMPEPAPADKSGSKWLPKSDKKKGDKTIKTKASKKGLGDAKVVMHDTSSDYNSTESNSFAGGSLASLKKDRNRSKVFGKLFRRKDSDGTSVISGISRHNESVESFGSGQASNSSAGYPSILVASAPMPPNHFPVPLRNAPATPVPQDPSVPPRSYNVPADKSGSVRTASTKTRRSDKEPAWETYKHLPNASTDQLLRDTQTGQPSVDGSDYTADTDNRPVAHAAATPGHAQVLGPPMSDEEDVSERRDQPRHLSTISGSTALSYPSMATDAPTVDSSDLVGFLVPAFPTSEPALEGTTILSTTVMRRVNLSQDRAEKWVMPFRSSQASSTSSSSMRRTIWQTHQLVLTSFRINERTPPSSPRGKAVDTPDQVQTVAHLHLFAFQAPRRASSSSYQGGSTGRRRPTVSMEGAGKVEVDRRAIGPYTVAGVWEGDDAEPSHGRRWVLRVKLDNQSEEWLCDMPSGDILFEWVRQIKAHVAVIRSEQDEDGPLESRTNSTGGADLASYVDQAEVDQRLRRDKLSPRPYYAPARVQAERDALRSLQGGHLSPPIPQPPSTDGHGREGMVGTTGLGISNSTAPGKPKSPLPALSSLPPPLPAPSYPPPNPPSLGKPSFPSQQSTTNDASQDSAGQVAFELPSPPSTTWDMPKTPAESPGGDLKVQIGPTDSPEQLFPDRSPGLEAAVNELKIDEPDNKFAGHTPPPSVRGDDGASVSSKGSSARAARRLKKVVPAVDLMAEVSARPEMNYDRFIEETEPIIEDRPRKIRFE